MLQLDEEEVDEFEMLENFADNASFCSNSSLVTKLFQKDRNKHLRVVPPVQQTSQRQNNDPSSRLYHQQEVSSRLQPQQEQSSRLQPLQESPGREQSHQLSVNQSKKETKSPRLTVAKQLEANIKGAGSDEESESIFQRYISFLVLIMYNKNYYYQRQFKYFLID